ncbi:uncharacterized protein [Procambarus clarkii]|uniref:uncharacterized protein n=1 Tax=Procambarus clarkii TaxID=6728 RepID=UPI00374288FB
MNHRLVLGSVFKKELTRLDRQLRHAIHGWLRLPHDTLNAFSHSDVKDGGLGIPVFATSICLQKNKLLGALVESVDPVVVTAALQPAFQARMHQRGFKVEREVRIPDGGTFCKPDIIACEDDEVFILDTQVSADNFPLSRPHQSKCDKYGTPEILQKIREYTWKHTASASSITLTWRGGWCKETVVADWQDFFLSLLHQDTPNAGAAGINIMDERSFHIWRGKNGINTE